MLLKDKNAVGTGCNRGIGKEIVRVFAENGSNIWACVRKENATFTKYINYLEQKLFTLAIAESKTGDGVNFIFTYNANTVNLSGLVKINHSGTLNNVETGTVVSRTSTKSDTTNIIGGQYYLYNLDVGSYDIIFTAEYDDEQFLNIITNQDLSSLKTFKD